ncbi:hypothetical protein DU508_16360 [Pedobacter chinensis]|uniref:Oligosaccharide repeat unit polymerase n=1 Tax=Pedobacter chinensis TaxID=2282421 RepID=A0A369PU70_9SPHI|nr:hypothetical protein [Pedobacter chinensis]RDC55832.1 hypothetical protein DU508_16360 [Pedobacter chinensis]
MESILISISLLVLGLGGYILWPSRYNVLPHLAVGGSFVSIVVPALILNVQDAYPDDIVALYTKIISIGAIGYVVGAVYGFMNGRGVRTSFTFDLIDSELYEKRVIHLTKVLMLIGIIGLVLSYMIMGFVPIFAENPIAAKLFRGPYQEPYSRVSILYRASFYIVSTIMPIACVVWYKYRHKSFLFLIIAILILMAVSLQRSGAFMGIVLAFAIVMSLKSQLHFVLLMIILIGVFVFSAFFYFIIGINAYTQDANVWQIISAGTPDIADHLDFLNHFDQNPVWTYGRTIYGGLIPGHYEWNPAVYTLTMVNPGADINDIGSGGLRLPLPVWGYVSFGYPGVILFSVTTGLLGGFFLRILKNIFLRFDSILIRTIGIVAFGSVVSIIVNFTQLNMFLLPPAFVCLFYLYRFRIK